MEFVYFLGELFCWEIVKFYQFFRVVLLQIHFRIRSCSDPGWFFPDPDPVKSFRSDRIRIQNTASFRTDIWINRQLSHELGWIGISVPIAVIYRHSNEDLLLVSPHLYFVKFIWYRYCIGAGLLTDPFLYKIRFCNENGPGPIDLKPRVMDRFAD
jgi:hypothetical protein